MSVFTSSLSFSAQRLVLLLLHRFTIQRCWIYLLSSSLGPDGRRPHGLVGDLDLTAARLLDVPLKIVERGLSHLLLIGVQRSDIDRWRVFHVEVRERARLYLTSSGRRDQPPRHFLKPMQSAR